MNYLPIGKQNFEDIIKRDLLYVDKTKQVFNLVKSGDLYLLSRPRRFGKSLLISTLRYLFEGKLVETDKFLYLMEFKLDEPAQDAIAQIKNRKYAVSYRNSPKTLYLVGAGFSKEERNVETWEAEVWERKEN